MVSSKFVGKIKVDSEIVSYPLLHKLAVNVLTMFGSTYRCESAFSTMNIMKNKYCTRLTNEHLHQCPHLATPFVPKFKVLATSTKCNLIKQCSVTHIHTMYSTIFFARLPEDVRVWFFIYSLLKRDTFSPHFFSLCRWIFTCLRQFLCLYLKGFFNLPSDIYFLGILWGGVKRYLNCILFYVGNYFS